jgi:hypothetical protein
MPPSRIGARVLDSRRTLVWLGQDFGEDWVVPKVEARCLVARRDSRQVLVTAYGRDGEVLGERVFAGDGKRLLAGLHEESLVDAWRDIPDDVASAREFLETGARAP